jgi:hypothetical protein
LPRQDKKEVIMLLTAQIIFFTVAIVAAYVYWVRPVLRSRPELKEFYDRSGGVWGALRLRFAGIKTRLLAVVSMAAAAIVRCTTSSSPTPSASIGRRCAISCRPGRGRSSCSPISGSSPSSAR